MELLQQIMNWISNNGDIVFGALFALSEIIGMLPGVKSSSIFQMIYNFLKEKVAKK